MLIQMQSTKIGQRKLPILENQLRWCIISPLTSHPQEKREGRKEGGKVKRKEGRREGGRKERRKEGRKGGREGGKEEFFGGPVVNTSPSNGVWVRSLVGELRSHMLLSQKKNKT